jgi:GTP cyclohydrolase IA
MSVKPILLDDDHDVDDPAPAEVNLAGSATATNRIDVEAAERAARAMLIALGADVSSPSLINTPARMAQGFAEMLTPQPFDMTTFPNDDGYDELVLAAGIPFCSLCEHHLLPFIGIAHVGYLPGKRIVGLSKLARVVDKFARGLQVQERMTMQIAAFIDEQLSPKGVGVVLSAEHMCMSVRGVNRRGTATVTSTVRGLLRESDRSRAEFFSLVDSHSVRV